MGLIIILQEMTHSIDYQIASFSRKYFRINQKSIVFLAHVVALLAKIVSIWGIIRKTRKSSILQDHEY